MRPEKPVPPRLVRHEDGTLYVFMAAPTEPWSINQERGEHWSVTGPRIAAWRDAACWAARELGVGRLEGRWEVTLRLPVVGERRRDPHNWVPPVKAWIDGAVIAKVWPDDTPEFVTVREPELEVGGSLVAVRLFPLG